MAVWLLGAALGLADGGHGTALAGGGEGSWIARDCNRDGRVDLSDAIGTLRYLFAGYPVAPCHALCDADRDGEITLGDALAILRHLFLSAGELVAAPPAEELCDGEDNDCDGEVDEVCPGGGRGAALTLAWDPVTQDVEGEPEEVAAYHVYFGTASGRYTYVRRTEEPRLRVAGLVPGETYYFGVTATDASGNESEFSEELAVRAGG